MDTRPKIKLKLNRTDKGIEIIGWIVMIALWALTLLNYFDLPEIIPIHYNATGKADGFGNKSNIFTLPIISTILFIGMTALNKYPHKLNYPVKLTEENALDQYTNATRMIRVLKLVIIIIFGLIVLRTIQYAHGTSNGLGVWFLPLTMGMMFIPMFYFIINAYKKKTRKIKQEP